MGTRGSGILLLFAAGVCSAGGDVESTRAFLGRPVVSVRFEPTVQPLPMEYLQRILPLKTGAPLRMEEVQEAIKKLFATGRYADVAVAGEPAGGGVGLVIRTTDQWFVGRVEAVGKIKEPPNKGQLANASRLELGRPYSDDELETAVRGVKSLLRRNGFYEAKVDPRLTRDAEHQQVDIVFSIDPGKRARFAPPVITGTPVIEAEDVVDAAHWKRFWFLGWKQVTADTTQRGLQGIRSKYSKQNRLASSVRLTKMAFDPATRRVTPTVNVVGGPKVDLKVVGAKVSKSRLRDYIPIYDEGAVDRDLLTEGARNLRNYFQIEGYFDVEVDYQENRLSEDHETITYVVNPGRRQKVAEVQVQGNTKFNTRTIRERMFIQPASFLRLRHGRYSTGFARRDEDAIKALYQSNGYRDVKVSTRTINDYRGKADEIAVQLQVVEGPQYLVSAFSMDGVKQVDKDKMVSMLSSVTGEPYSDLNVALDRSYILGVYNAAGFPQATFTSRMKPGAEPHRMEVNYAVNEGPRKFVRDVVFSGLEETKMRLVEPAVRLKAKDPLSIQAMTETQHDLNNLGIFDEVDTAIQNPDGETDDKYVLYEFREGHRYALAAGFGAEFARIGGAKDNWSSPGGQTGFSPRASVDFSRLNLWGLGHTATLKGVVSSLQQTASLSYLAPRYRNVDGRNITVTGLYDLRRDVRTFTGKRVEASTQLSQKFSKATTMLYRFSYRRVSVDPGSLKIEPLLVPLLAQPARIGMLSTSLVNDRRDDPSDAHRGIYSTLDGGVSTKGFGSQVSFLRFLGTNATYKTFHQNLVFAQRTQFGFLRPFSVKAGVDPVEAIPLPERLFSGGSTSLRAFPDNQAGPRDTFGGFPLGGNAILIHNTELRFPFLGDNMDGVLFHDMGNVYSNLSHISFRVHQRNLQDFDYMAHAVGFGIRYRTPVGPVRLDLAYSINPPEFFGFKGSTIDVLTGVAPRVQQRVSRFQFFFSIGQAF